MENGYWIGRKRSAMGMACAAATAEARLIHYDLAGRYSIKAAQCSPSAVPGSERAALPMPRPETRPPATLHLRAVLTAVG